MKILYLYSELVGYQIPILKTYTEKYNAEVCVISWDKNRLKPYEHPEIENVKFIKRSLLDNDLLLRLSLEFNPDIVYISGWMDKGYLNVTRKLKKIGIPIVTGFDDIWISSIRQRIGAMIFPLLFKKYFSHAWVAGPYQFEFAKRLGFKNDEIIFDLLSANVDNYSQKAELKLNSSKPLPHSFLYVGNFRKVKGVDILIKAYNIYKAKYNGHWNLICVGNGELEDMLRETGIDLRPFSNENELIKLAIQCGVFILPSRHDQWGVVVHEFTSIGMPIILSENVGAKATFFIEKFNGLLFRNNSAEDLANKMFMMSCMDDLKLIEMGANSHLLSKRISVETSAASFISLIEK